MRLAGLRRLVGVRGSSLSLLPERGEVPPRARPARCRGAARPSVPGARGRLSRASGAPASLRGGALVAPSSPGRRPLQLTVALSPGQASPPRNLTDRSPFWGDSERCPSPAFRLLWAWIRFPGHCRSRDPSTAGTSVRGRLKPFVPLSFALKHC